MLATLQEQPTTRLSTREVIAAATATTHVFDAPVAAARYELFRRALVERDEEAWETLYHAYECLLASWISKQISVPVETYDALLSDVWMKLLLYIRTAEKFAQFANLGAVLAYLKCCTMTACVDYIRAQARMQSTTLSLETVDMSAHSVFAVEQDLLYDVRYQDLLHDVEPLLRTEQERIMVQVLLIEQEKPSTLLKWYPDLFDSVESIYWSRRKLVERLQRSRVLKAASLDR